LLSLPPSTACTNSRLCLFHTFKAVESCLLLSLFLLPPSLTVSLTVSLRARIEKEYGDNLVRLAEKAAGKEELGTLRKSWDQLKSETDAVGRLHLSLSQKITDDILKAVREFKDQQRETRKKSEDTVKRAAGHKRTCYQSTNRARATYETRCKEADKAEETFNKVQSPGTAKQQEIAKVCVSYSSPCIRVVRGNVTVVVLS
jgi:proline-serine-threonine phosphatase interacting protein 1